MPLPVPGFMDAERGNNDLNQVETVNDIGAFNFFQVSHSCPVDAFFLLFRESLRRPGARGVPAGFDFNKRQNPAVAGNDVNFAGFDFVIPAEDFAVFGLQQCTGQLFTPSAGAQVRGSGLMERQTHFSSESPPRVKCRNSTSKSDIPATHRPALVRLKKLPTDASVFIGSDQL